ncbi:hypothetical protein Hanom_Chr04g00316451 [Helianthus anomalus]
MEKVEVSPSMHVGRKSQCVDASPGFLSSSCGSVPDETCIEGKMLLMNQTLRKFIQWPRKAIKILDAQTHRTSKELQTPPQTRTCNLTSTVDPYIPKMQLSSDVPIQLGINDFLTDDILLPDGFLDTMNASECPQNQDAEQQMVMKPVVQKSQTEQPKPKKAMATKNKSKGKRKQVQAKLTYQERQAEKVKLHLQLIELRPEWHKKMVGRLGGYIGNDWATTLPYSAAPENMFPSQSGTYIEVESMLALFVKDWVDLTIVFWFTWYFYKESKDKKGNQCAFLNVNSITGDMCKRNPREVEDHILSLATHHIDKDFILAPHLAE